MIEFKSKKIQNYVVNASTGETIYTPPPANEVPILMAELVTWLNTPTDIHPVLIKGKITIQDYEALCPKISRRTLQRDFKYMLEKNVIREKGGGGATDPTRHYVLAKL